MAWKVGELAARVGLTVRTLHHYDDIGLLRPTGRTDAGHRLYNENDLRRLLWIRALRALGLSLADIRSAIDGGPDAALGILEAHIASTRAQIREAEAMCDRLEGLVRATRSGRHPRAPDILAAMEEITMFEKYYTPEQLEALARRREALGEDTIRAAEAEWPELIAKMTAARARGAAPDDPEVQRLARRWQELVDMFTGGDPAIRQSLANLYRGEPQMATQQGMDGALMDFVQKAISGLAD